MLFGSSTEIVMHDTYIGGRSENNIKCVVHDDLWRKNRTTRYNCRFSDASLHGFTSDFLSFIVVEHSVHSRSPSTSNTKKLWYQFTN